MENQITIDIPSPNGKHIRFENLTQEQADYLTLVSQFHQVSGTRRSAVLPEDAPKIYHPNNYPYTIKWCPGYEGYIPENLNHEVCKRCGSISYYH